MADPPAEITAEWTVHAQLTILRGDQPRSTAPAEEPTAPGDADRTAKASVAPQPTSYSSSSTSAPGGGGGSNNTTTPNGQPLRVVYKWSSDDLKAAGCNGRSGLHFGSEQKYPSFTSNSTNDSGCCPHPNTGHLTSETEAADCSPKCRSTCSIVLSACTDLYPTPVEGNAMAPPQYNTTATCVVTPSTGKIYRHSHTSPFNTSTSVSGGEQIAQFLSVKDAFCQTNDVDFKAKSEPRTVQPTQSVPQRTRSQRAYDYRRSTDSSLFQSNSLLSPNISFEEGTSQTPFSRQPSHSPVLIRQVSSPTPYVQTYSPTPNVRVHHTAPSATSTAKNYHSIKSTPKKSPRTVHIDVYCTGSEAEEEEEEEEDSDDSVQSDAGSSSSSYAQHHHPHHFHFDDDAASNSTPQTVFNANQIKLHHSRMTNRRELPRRLAINQANNEPSAFPNIKPGQLRQYILDQANAKDEINESKQMLFSKHMGANHPCQPSNDDDRSHVPSKFSFSRHQGHFCPVEPSEAGYSSNYPNSSRSTFRDPTCSSISDAMASSSAVFDELEQFGPNPDCNVSNADSFEYENAADRARISQMELTWRNAGFDDMTRDGSSNKGWRSPEKERKFLLKQRKTMDHMHQNPNQIREMTEEESPARCMAESNVIYNNVSAPPRRHHRVLFTPNYEPSDRDMPHYIERSPSMTHDSVDHGNLCTRFGTRLETTRKKHFGPAKNPDCPCDHCRRWATERGATVQQMRGRTMSMGEEQMVVGRRSAFWLTRH